MEQKQSVTLKNIKSKAKIGIFILSKYTGKGHLKKS